MKQFNIICSPVYSSLVLSFKVNLDSYWTNQEVYYNYKGYTI